MKRISVKEARACMLQGAVVVDVREPTEFTRARIEGTVNVPLATFTPAIAAELHRKNPLQPLVVMCLGGVRSARACSMLPTNFLAVMMEGGLQAWRSEDLPVVEERGQGFWRGLLGA